MENPVIGSREWRIFQVDPSDSSALEDVRRIEADAFGENGLPADNISLMTVPGWIYLLREGKTATAEAILFGNLGDPGAFLFSLAVARDFRGEGRGSFLLDFILDRLKSRGVPYLDLTVNPRNRNAVHLYRERFGFQRIGEIRSPDHPDRSRLVLRKTIS